MFARGTGGKCYPQAPSLLVSNSSSSPLNMTKTLLLLIFHCTVSVQVLGGRNQTQNLFSVSAAGLRFERGAQNPHYHTLCYVRANAAHVWLEQWGSCHHTPWQRDTLPPPAVRQEAERDPANQHLHREVIMEEAETYQNDFDTVMLTTYTTAWHTFPNVTVAECYHCHISGSF